jgi:hypothetical protein
MERVPKFVRPMSGLVALAVAACAADSPMVEGLMVVPSYYDTLQCSELVGQFVASSQRVHELTILREKAADDPGGVVANALTYNTEYAKAEATKKYVEAAANRKGCELPKKTTVSAKPRPEGSTPPHPRRQPRHTHAVNARGQDSAGFLNRSVSDFLTSNADVSIFVSQSRVARPLSATIAQHSRY